MDSFTDPLMHFDYYLVTEEDGVTYLNVAVGEELQPPLPGHGEMRKVDFWEALQWDAGRGGGHLPCQEAQGLLQYSAERLAEQPSDGARADDEPVGPEELRRALDDLGVEHPD